MLALLVQQENLDLLVSLGHLDPLEYQVILEDLVSLAKKDHQDHLVHKVDLGCLDHLDYLDFLEKEVYQDYL